ncbi:MAG: hypothetical protein HHJ16_10155 [Polaromonas sp.]|uniref:hypothetical protein n=1 Tax=Polaromonas sp. TaxID=1869339 RepID=UPI0017F9D8BB|nr:hypothetical protein [Polaromonas sp.]NMM10624.1 hypothetical protein [Polaromonas sp.]
MAPTPFTLRDVLTLAQAVSSSGSTARGVAVAKLPLSCVERRVMSEVSVLGTSK